MKSDKISVIIILFFSKHLLAGIISNVRQKINDLGEIILINNSGENLDEFKLNDVAVIYPKENLGYGGGINLAVDNSKNEFLLILNPDLTIEKFDVALTNIKGEIIISGPNPKIPGYSLKFPSLLGSFFSIAVIDLAYSNSLDRLCHYKRIPGNPNDYNVDYVSGALIFTTKTTFKKIGGFDSNFFLYYEETDFCKRASYLKIPVKATTKITFRPNSDKASAKNVDNIKIKSGIMSCKRYHSKHNGIITTRFVFLLLKLIHGILIVTLFPFSFSKRITEKRRQFEYRFKFL